jgi:hypothetical protein
MTKLGTLAVLGLLLGVGLYPGLGAAVMVRLSLQQLSRESDTIVLGTVTQRVSAWNTLHTAIYTDVMVTVGEVIKGTPASELIIRIAGGIVGDIGMRTSTAPEMQDGDQVILFLRTAHIPASVVGEYQGAYTVSNGTVTRDGQQVAVGDFIKAIRAASL